MDEAAVDIVHGHSSHHPKGIEAYKGKPILYGCGDFLSDYEGIGAHARPAIPPPETSAAPGRVQVGKPCLGEGLPGRTSRVTRSTHLPDFLQA